MDRTLDSIQLTCVSCGTRRGASLAGSCDACDGILEVEAAAAPGGIVRPIRSLGDLAAVIPLPPHPVSLGEGATPLLGLDHLYPSGQVLAKVEGSNPTGSFKDRGVAVATSWALALGGRRLVAASTGNNAASVSAYAARAGLPSVVLVPAATSPEKLAQSIAAGARVVVVDESFSVCHLLANRLGRGSGWADLTSTYANPWLTEGHKSIAYELVDRLGGAPGSVIIPVGAGPMVAGVMKGFEEMLDAGMVDRTPVPVAVQAEGCAPIVRAFDEGADAVEPWAGPAETIAGSIADPLEGYPEHGARTLAVLRRHGGIALAVSDDKIAAAGAELGKREGILAEPAGAATLAALRAASDLPRPVVLVVSGHGLKDPRSLTRGAPSPVTVSADAAEEEILALVDAGPRGDHERLGGPDGEMSTGAPWDMDS